MSEESNTWISIFLLDLVTITVLSTTVLSFHQLLDALTIMGFFSFILPFFTLSLHSTCRSNGWLLSLSHQHLLEPFSGSYKVEHHCSGITFTSMRLESQLQSIYAVVAAFLQIFLTFFLPYPFLMFIPTSRIAQNAVPYARPTLLTSTLLSQGEICHRTYFQEP